MNKKWSFLGACLMLTLSGCSNTNQSTENEDDEKKVVVQEKQREETQSNEEESRRVRLIIGEQEMYATLNDDPAAESLMAMLPTDFTFEDFNGVEKIGYPNTPFYLDESTYGGAPAAGDIAIYAPWGNLSIFYQQYQHNDDLIMLGHIDEGLEVLTSQTSNFTVRMELAD